MKPALALLLCATLGASSTGRRPKDVEVKISMTAEVIPVATLEIDSEYLWGDTRWMTYFAQRTGYGGYTERGLMLLVGTGNPQILVADIVEITAPPTLAVLPIVKGERVAVITEQGEEID